MGGHDLHQERKVHFPDIRQGQARGQAGRNPPRPEWEERLPARHYFPPGRNPPPGRFLHLGSPASRVEDASIAAMSRKNPR